MADQYATQPSPMHTNPQAVGTPGHLMGGEGAPQRAMTPLPMVGGGMDEGGMDDMDADECAMSDGTPDGHADCVPGGGTGGSK